MKAGNYAVKGGKVHRYGDGGSKQFRTLYVCGIDVLCNDLRTTKPVTCRNCLRMMRWKK